MVKPFVRSGLKQPLSLEAINAMIGLFNAGQWQQLEASARSATVAHPEHVFGWKALAKALMIMGRPAEALLALEKAIKISPGDADAAADLGEVLHRLGRFDAALASYERALKLNPRGIGMHCNMGMLLRDMGKFDAAMQAYRAELEVNSNSATAWNNIGSQLSDLGQYEEAQAACKRAIELQPVYPEAFVNLGHVSCELGDTVQAESCYRHAIALAPNLAPAHSRLGVLLGRDLARADEAIGCLQRAVALNPGDADALNAIGNLLLGAKRIEESNAVFRRAQQLVPFVTWRAITEKPAFSVLMLDAPGAGCTPLNYLAGKSNYECHFLALLPGVEYDVAALRAKADIVVNMIADADNGKDVLPRALALADALAMPTLNHPRMILGSDRESVARKTAHIARCRSPRTIRLLGAQLAGPGRDALLAGFQVPLLVRRAGTHGGDDFDKVDSFDAIGPMVAGHPEDDFYISEFIDYQSPDGCYRKYRFICIGGQMLPYHLAIHEHWMVHHFRTDMGEQAWKREEEESFLADHTRYFGPEQMAALYAVRDAVALDYCGIDCALDKEGNVVIFESNATMLVHDEKVDPFRYKNPYIAKIKAVFDATLAEMAGKGAL